MGKRLYHRLWQRLVAPLLVTGAQVIAILVFVFGNWLLILPSPASALQPAPQQFSQPCGNPGTPSAVHHVIWITMENEVYNKVIGNTTGAPYQNQLASQCGIPTNMYSESHGSLINYMSATNGQNITTNSQYVTHNDCSPNTGFCYSSTPSIFSQIDSTAGESWRSYAEDMPSNCYQSNSGNYAVRHNPAVYYTGLSDCAQYDVPMGNLATQSGAFYSDVQNGTLPSFSFITPNLIDDAHDSSVTVGDTWLSQIVPMLTSGANYQSGDTAIFITNDEGGAGTPDHVIGEDCANQALAASQPSCHIPTIVVAPYVAADTQDSSFYTHYSMLRTTEELLGLPLLGQAAAANSMMTAFNLGSGSVQPPTLQPVTNLAATATGSSQINVSWTASALATGYTIMRNGAAIGSTSSTSFNDTGLTPSTSYSYSVVATDSVGDNASSNTVSCTTLAVGLVQWVGNQSVETNLTGWTGITSNNSKSSQIFGGYDGLYSLRSINSSSTTSSNGFIDKPRWVDGSVGKTTVGGTIYTASVWVKADVAGQKITLFVREFNPSGTAVNKAPYNVGVSVTASDTNWFKITEAYPSQATGDNLSINISASNVAAGQGFNADLMSLTSPAVIPIDSTPPTAPTNFTAVPVSQTQVNLSWTAASDNVGVTGYTISRNGVAIGTTTNTNYSDAALTANTAYSYAVTAIDAAQNVGPPASATASTPPVLGAPTNLEATTPSPSEADLSWTAAVGATSYAVERNGVTVGVATGTSYVDSGLAAQTSYSYTVVASDNFDGSVASNPLAVTTPGGSDVTPPSQPTNLVAIPVNQTQMYLSWTAASDDFGVTGYNILRNGALVGTTSSTVYVDQGLTAGTTYGYSVTAFDAANNVSTAATVNGTTPPVLGTPANLLAAAASQTELDLTWSSALGATNYSIQRNGTTVGSATGTSYADTGLTANTTYSYTVTASDAYGNSATSTSQQATTQANTTPPPLALCGNQAPTYPVAIKHVIIVMLENNSYKKVVGSTNAPYQTSLSQQCGTATAMFGATHTSAANYLALSAGEYPAASPPGCGSVKACADASNNLYHELDTAALSWRSYQEAMPAACTTTTGGAYKIGHNPPLFYSNIPSTECKANDLPVTDLTAQSGAFWNDLTNQTLPSLSWVTPSLNNDGEGAGGGTAGLQLADTWVKNFIATVKQSNSYQAGNTLLLITYDEGTGSDTAVGEDCTNQSLDMPVTNGTSAHQDSCHVPFFVVYPYTPTGSSDATFFDHYSVTKTVENLFGLPYLAHAGDYQTNSLIGHFGIH